jgi:hypothetical protein
MSALVPINSTVSYEMLRRLFWLSDLIRALGIHLVAGKGSGKSRLLGRVIAWLDFMRETPLVILDPVGQTIDNFLDRLTRSPRKDREQLYQRVIYVDMGGCGGTAVGWPLYYRLGNESLYAISQRYLDVVRRVDPALQSASIEGFNALWRIGTYTGMILAALGCQITEAEDLLRNPEAWVPRITQALQTYPELQEAASFFTEQYMQWKEDKKASRTDAFRTKIAPLILDPAMRAMFGADTQGIDWAQVVEKRQAVLLDFRHVPDVERRRFLMLWAYTSLMEFIKHRGAGYHCPLSLIVDELAALANFRTSTGSSLFADDLEELINVYARNCSVWLTLAHQEIYQFEERIQKTLMTMGTHIFGVTSDMDAALSFARQLYRYDPHKVKRTEPMYMSSLGEPFVVDEREVMFTIEEQNLINSDRFRSLKPFHFLVRPAPAAGDGSGRVYGMSSEILDRDIWVNEERVARARCRLQERCGVSIAQQLAAIEARLQMNLTQRTGRISVYDNAHSLPVSEDDDDESSLREEKAPAPETGERRRTAPLSAHPTRP